MLLGKKKRYLKLLDNSILDTTENFGICHEIIENLTRCVIIVISVKREEGIGANEKERTKNKNYEKTA